MNQQVHLNALGIVCALGSGKDEVAQALFAGASGVQMLDAAVTSGASMPFGLVTSPLAAIPEALARYASPNLAYALTALAQIEDEVQQAIKRYGADRVAVVMGSSTSGLSVGEQHLGAGGPARAATASFDFLQQEIGSTAESLAVYLAVGGPALTISTACTSGAKALATGRRLLRQGLADAVLVGGSDSQCQLTLNGFNSLAALSTSACRPFSANRDGTVIGEGAALFLMTREPVGPVLAGIGESADAHNMTAPQPDGAGAVAAMEAALADAGIAAADLSYVNLHGTGTALNDSMESLALAQVVAADVPCSSSKGQLGHTLGAAGAIEAAICWLTLECNPGQLLPPHVWDGAPDEQALLPGMVRPGQRLGQRLGQRGAHHLLSNSYAFGGNNMALVLADHHGH